MKNPPPAFLALIWTKIGIISQNSSMFFFFFWTFHSHFITALHFVHICALLLLEKCHLSEVSAGFSPQLVLYWLDKHFQHHKLLNILCHKSEWEYVSWSSLTVNPCSQILYSLEGVKHLCAAFIRAPGATTAQQKKGLVKGDHSD